MEQQDKNSEIARIKPDVAELSAAEREAIDHELTLYPKKSAACIEALKIVQMHRRWVDDQAVVAVASYLDMSTAEVDSVATFYNLIFRRPVGKQVIYFCNSVSCYLTGGDGCRKKISQQLGVEFGETTADNEFTLLPITCLGACDKAPVMMVEKKLYTQLNEENIADILGLVRRRASEEDELC